LVEGHEKFVAFVGLNAKFVTIVANEEVPAHAKKFPVFRAGTPNLATKRAL